MRSAQSRGAICLAALQCQQQAAARATRSARVLMSAALHRSACDTSARACDTARRREDHGESRSENCLLYSSCFSHVVAEYFIAVVSHISRSVVVRAAACVFDTEHPIKRVERQILGEWLLSSAQRQSETFC